MLYLGPELEIMDIIDNNILSRKKESNKIYYFIKADNKEGYFTLKQNQLDCLVKINKYEK
jgi:hypothetical protein